MPFKSLSQARLIAMKESKGELPSGTFKHWKAATPSMKALPEHVKKASERDGHGVWKCDECGALLRRCDCPDATHCYEHVYAETCPECRDTHSTKEAGLHDHRDAWVANVIAPYKAGWIASLRPIDKRERPGDFGTVGGKLDDGETAWQAAKREANEEGWAIYGMQRKPIHVAETERGKIVTFAANGARKLYDHKERDREVHQITVDLKQLADSHSHNSFLHKVDPKNYKKDIGTTKTASLIIKTAANIRTLSRYYDILKKNRPIIKTERLISGHGSHYNTETGMIVLKKDQLTRPGNKQEALMVKFLGQTYPTNPDSKRLTNLVIAAHEGIESTTPGSAQYAAKIDRMLSARRKMAHFDAEKTKRPFNDVLDDYKKVIESIHGYEGHGSPSVMAREHNLMVNLSGPGSDETKKWFQLMRSNSQIGDFMHPGFVYGEGPRIGRNRMRLMDYQVHTGSSHGLHVNKQLLGDVIAAKRATGMPKHADAYQSSGAAFDGGGAGAGITPPPPPQSEANMQSRAHAQGQQIAQQTAAKHLSSAHKPMLPPRKVRFIGV